MRCCARLPESNTGRQSLICSVNTESEMRWCRWSTVNCGALPSLSAGMVSTNDTEPHDVLVPSNV
jgi:hypothetical protein